MTSSNASKTVLPKDAVSDGLTRFASHLYQALCKGIPYTENFFISPLSITEALSMLLRGTAEDTEVQMKQVLQVSSIDSSEMHESIKAIRTDLLNSSDELSIANRIFVQEGFNLNLEFVNSLEKLYGSSCKTLDFSGNSVAAASAINQWVSDATREKIKNIIDPGAAALSKMVLANAVYFKSAWKRAFDKSLTHLADFQTSDGQVATVEMMHMEGRFEMHRLDSLECDTLWLPYRSDDLGMLILLPRHADSLSRIEAAFGPELLQEVFDGDTNRKVLIWLPKFTLEQSYSLESTLKDMGMKDLFSSGRANLSKLSTSEGLYVSSVVHKTFVDVSEEGTEAAAATTVRLMSRSLKVEEKLEFRADHPFLFGIIHKRQKSILFIGALKSPPSVATKHQEL